METKERLPIPARPGRSGAVNRPLKMAVSSETCYIWAIIPQNCS